MRIGMAALLLAASVGCSREPDSGMTTTVQLVGSPFTLDLISTSNCQLLNGRLRKCAIASRAFFPPDVAHAVPKRTVLTRVATGNCSTPYALEVTVSAKTEMPSPSR